MVAVRRALGELPSLGLLLVRDHDELRREILERFCQVAGRSAVVRRNKQVGLAKPVLERLVLQVQSPATGVEVAGQTDGEAVPR